MWSTKRILLSSVTMLECLKLTLMFQINIPKPDTVYISVPFDEFKNIQWFENPNYMESTCGTFKAYDEGTIQKIVGRWYTMYVSNIPSTTHHCSQFTNVKGPCGCSGIDFTIALNYGVISFVMFSTNTIKQSVTYELATATIFGNRQLNMNKIILRSFVLNSNAKVTGLGGFVIPRGVIVDSDDFNSYIIMVFCKEGATKPSVMILVKALPISKVINNVVFKYLNENKFDSKLYKVNHENCQYGKNIVGDDYV
ncbi:PREDICTED: uncharacterized protein LOC107164082 isoform X2 [Diuraphis noxia]|uniref:uncharacterized protein LOC107164082 isoform X2 n=1 Tax=Diuraphis noxia TaxID=143948 RepID=UPI0007637EAE|nr:PREDICTED: uncharacterized protein LOC107164082 isoform X2 [Diuraphis noxia]